MSQERWQSVEDLFHAALERPQEHGRNGSMEHAVETLLVRQSPPESSLITRE
jgi:hypothetical protein